ncbi:uncharacterized protein EV420DRAFT_1649316 [Desarmillaria tabescens]|uniref:Uncharacterized protein n=1 Tax=Armillaria tabescens TaxID=1929756 RepID=A0AA39JJK1_ARMTA|nr:uncharacterized protein EV420DRAFT_1649316 [Desarmillaria tabescens]KAK0443382.1 hypothetical protein EV420DRAFT_1649316 [Desarmillaria tabescens]
MYLLGCGTAGQVHPTTTSPDRAAKFSIQVISYDQLGSSRLTHRSLKQLLFLSIGTFINQLANLLRRFRIQDGFFRGVGHSV